MKRFVQGAAVLSVAVGLSLAAAPAAAQAQKYPSRPIKLIVPVPPGSGTDLIARTVGGKMSEHMGVPVVVENRGGASAAIGTDALAKSPADGYTIMMGYTVHATNPIFNSKLPYDTLRDTAPIAYVCYIPLVLDVHPSVPVNSVQELIALAKSQPGKIAYASGGAGAGAHLSGELFRILTRTDVVHIPYKGNAPAVADLLGGQVHMMFDIVTTSLPLIRAGKLKGLAVTSTRRSSLAPELPTMIEAGLPGFEVVGWYMLLAPAGMPKDVMTVLNAEVNRAIKDPEVGAKLGSQGVEWVGGTPEQADSFLRAEMARWGKIAKETGMKAD
ncbi:MAG: tripartite tricarboxylate transporter substrate binding protein [Betaproteobacteria bacterium]|nr:tripartite tricarboxylate transporter substrate binding protein [Betaproteobacteria bacterium]